ncbi:MAG: PorT family protein [Chitinophagia bacterium]|nr:PorT family protein [Chitinophagia bacterium]
MFHSFSRLLGVAFVTLFIVAFAGKAGAQEGFSMYENRTFYGGLVLGGNFVQVDGDNFAGYHKVGLNAGGLVYIKLDEHIAGSIEVLFSQKGSRAAQPQQLMSGVYITKYGIDLNYAEVPLMINYFDDHMNHFGAGISYARLANANEYITTNPSAVYNTEQYPFKKSDVNFLLGGSLHCYKGLFFNLRFQYSLLSIRDKIPTNYVRAAQYNNMWTVRMVYVFL